MKKLLLFLLFLSLGLAAETLHEWSFANGTAGASGNPKQVAVTVDPAVKTPGGAPALAVKLLERPEEGPAHAVSVNFITETELVPGSRCRVTFQLRSDREGKVAAGCLLRDKPWSQLGPRSSWSGTVNGEWQNVTIEFTVDQEGKRAVRAPMLMLGDFPVGGTIYVGPVCFEKVVNFLPLALNPEWKVRFEATGVEKTVTLKDNAVDLGPAKEKTAALLVNEFDSPEAGMMQVGCAADWWFEFSVNGKAVYDTLATGNRESGFQPADHIFNFPVVKGKNRVEVRVLAGSAGWKFVCGAVPFRAKTSRITEIVRSAEWRPVKMDQVEWENITPKRIDAFKILPGSALDLSRYVPRYDIDRLGRLVIGTEGHLMAEKDPAARIRLRGFNAILGSFYHNFYKLSHAELEELAEEIRLQGMNALRLHFFEGALCGHNGLPWQGERRKKLSEVPMAQTVEELPIDPVFLDRFHWFAKCLRDRGVYLMVDIATNFAGWTQAATKTTWSESFYYGLFENEQYRRNWRAGFDFLMNRVNPYTKTRMLDDPQYIGITFFNEQEHIFNKENFNVFDPAWRKLHPNAPGFSEELLRADSADGAAARKFLLAEVDQMNRFYLDTVRESGFRGVVTQWDMFVRNLEGIAREPMSAVAMHSYFAHPHNQPLLPANYQQRLSYGAWLKGTMATVDQQSSIRLENSWFGRAAAVRAFGKPFLLTEFSHNAYNRFVHEAGPLMGAYAALQGWDMIAPHSNMVMLYYRPLQAFSFDFGPNPMAMLGSLFTAFLWQRGDVAEAKHMVNFAIPREVCESPRLLDAVGSGGNALFMLTRIGSSYGRSVPGATLEVLPRNFVGVRSHGMYIGLENEKPEAELRSLVGQLREKGVLPAGNRTDVGAGLFQSETGEITADTRSRTLTVITPRSEAAVLKENHLVKLDALTVEAVSGPCTVAAISLENDRPLRESKRILLIYGTMAVAENTVFSTENFDAEIDVGRLQLLIRSGEFRVTLATAQKKLPRVYALNLNGGREKELPVAMAKGKLALAVDTSKLEFGTPYFEIVY